ncbi:hypothetical protein ACW7N6_38315 [Streptomyces sp. UC1A3]
MTSYSVERPVRRPARPASVRPGLAHLHPNQVTTGQPVTIRTLDENGNEVEFAAVYVRRDRTHLCCAPVDGGPSRRYRPSQVFPRRVEYRRWTVTLTHKDISEDGGGEGRLPVFVNARTELEARYAALAQIKARYGERSNWTFRLHSVRREG